MPSAFVIHSRPRALGISRAGAPISARRVLLRSGSLPSKEVP